MPARSSAAILGASIRQPVPRENAFDGDSDVVPERTDRLKQQFRVCLHVAMKNDRAGLVENAQVHGSCVQINSAVMRMLLRIEFHRPPFLRVPSGNPSFTWDGRFLPNPFGGGLNQYQADAADALRR